MKPAKKPKGLTPNDRAYFSRLRFVLTWFLQMEDNELIATLHWLNSRMMAELNTRKGRA